MSNKKSILIVAIAIVVVLVGIFAVYKFVLPKNNSSPPDVVEQTDIIQNEDPVEKPVVDVYDGLEKDPVEEEIKPVENNEVPEVKKPEAQKPETNNNNNNDNNTNSETTTNSDGANPAGNNAEIPDGYIYVPGFGIVPEPRDNGYNGRTPSAPLQPYPEGWSDTGSHGSC